MPVPAFSIKAAISTCLVTALLMPIPALAALTATDASRLDAYETTVFGKPRKSMSEESRLRALETNLFGKTKSGNARTRLDAVARLVSPNASANKPEYLPPLAAQLDRSVFPTESEPTRAPSYSDRAYSERSQSDNYEQPAPVAQSDRSKELLKQALTKYGQGDRSGAQRLFKQVLAIDPRNADANFNLGAMAEDEGDLSGAQRYYRAAASANPNDGEVRDALDGVTAKMQQQEQARRTAQQVEKKNELRQLAQSAATAYKSGNYDQAISLLERIDREAPGDANVKYGLGQAYRGKGDMGRARANLQAAASLDPGNSLYRSTLSELDRHQQQQIARQSQSQPSYGDEYASQGGRDYGDSMPPVASDFEPVGQITPFANDDNDRLYGHAYDTANRGIGIGGMSLGGIGSALGMGGLGMGLGSLMSRNDNYYSAPSRGSRLVRGALGGSLAGAAAGAITGAMRGGGGVKSGAMKGALYGGLFGLLSSF